MLDGGREKKDNKSHFARLSAKRRRLGVIRRRQLCAYIGYCWCQYRESRLPRGQSRRRQAIITRRPLWSGLRGHLAWMGQSLASARVGRRAGHNGQDITPDVSRSVGRFAFILHSPVFARGCPLSRKRTAEF